MHLFGRAAIPMIWDFAEANILGRLCWWLEHAAVITLPIASRRITSAYTVRGTAHQIDARRRARTESTTCLVSTDPPYYDNIGYAALSDFFYVWLRRTIGDLYPDLFSTVLVPEDAMS